MSTASSFNHPASWFDKLMRIYTPCFFPLIVLAFVTNEMMADLTPHVVRFWLCLHVVLVGLAFTFQQTARNLTSDNPDAILKLAWSNMVDKRRDIISLIAACRLRVADNITTVDPNALAVLDTVNKTPLLHCVTFTIHDHHYLRFGWLKADKSNPEQLINKLLIGDTILFHRKRSLRGAIIRAVTRCYWEHCGNYAGDGEIIHITLDGFRRETLLPLLLPKTTDIAILRAPKDSKFTGKEMVAFFEKEGLAKIEYNYFGIMEELWRIITDKKCDGLLTPLTVIINLGLCLVAFFATFSLEQFSRLQILLLALSGPYLFDTVYHWVAYRHDVKEQLK